MAILPLNSVIGLGLLTLSTMVAHMVSTIAVPTDDGRVGVGMLCALTILPTWVAGLIFHFYSLDAPTQKRSAAVALVGVNLAWQIKPGYWYLNLLNALWPAYVGLLVGATVGKLDIAGGQDIPITEKLEAGEA